MLFLRSIVHALVLLIVGAALVGLAVQQPAAATYVALGQTAAQQLDWQRALNDYHAAVVSDPGNADAYIGMAQIWFWQHKHAAASAAISHAIQTAPSNQAAWVLAGEIVAQGGDTTSALTDWRQSLHLAPQTTSGLSAAALAADMLLDQGAPDQTLALITSLPRLTPHLRWDEALALLHLERVGQARTLMAALPTGASSPAYLTIAAQWQGTARDEAALGYADIISGRPALAITPLRDAIATDSTYGSGHAYLTWALWQTGQMDAASGQLALAKQDAPNDPVTVGVQALISSGDGQATQALATLQAWLAAHGSSPALWAITATIADAANDPAAEEDAWWHLATTATGADRPAATIALARFYLATGLGRDDGRAAWAIATAQALNPQDATTADLAAQWATQAGQPDQALADLRQAIALDPRLAIAHAHLGALEFHMGDLTAAAIELRHADDLDTTGVTSSLIGPLLAILGDSAA